MSKYLVACLGVMLLLGLGTTGMAAVTDGTGDAFVTGSDLLSVDAIFYPPAAGTSTTTKWVKLVVTMAAGSTLPGMITWDFDADDNLATGAGSSLNMPFLPCPPTRCKTELGFDFYILLVTRDQGDSSNNAYCNNCVGTSAQCVTRGATVACTEGTCYEPADVCGIGDPDCYEIDEPCSGSLECENAYPLTVPCGASAIGCGTGLQFGEFYAGFGTGGNKQPIYRGRVVAEIGEFAGKTQYCFILPWETIATEAAVKDAVEYANLVQNPPYQVSIWHDPVFADREDFFDPGLTLNLTDYVPNAGYAASVIGAAECTMDGNGDCKVNLTDLTAIKAEFNRSNCPNCGCTK